MIINDFSASFFFELILEMFPISSSGHILLLSNFYKNIEPLSFLLDHISHSLIFFIQVWYVFPFFLSLIRRGKILNIVKIILYFFCTTLITSMGYIVKGLLFDKLLWFNFPLFLGFFITTFCLITIFFTNSSRTKLFYNFTFSESIFFGLLQCFALLPGISRLSIILLGATLCRYTKENALFMAIMSNISISLISMSYIVYYSCSIESISIILSNACILKLIFSMFFSMLCFFLFIYLFKKNKIVFFIVYEFLLTLFVYCIL
jgi:undecaprenyl-diphosphatase